MSNATVTQDKGVFEAAALCAVDRALETQTTTSGKRVLSLEAVLDRVPVSRTTLWRMERAGLFPQRIQVSTNRVGWIEADIDAWVEGRKRGYSNNG
jgi:predicted DNA-binding transcriptional regulator AlpA